MSLQDFARCLFPITTRSIVRGLLLRDTGSRRREKIKYSHSNLCSTNSLYVLRISGTNLDAAAVANAHTLLVVMLVCFPKFGRDA